MTVSIPDKEAISLYFDLRPKEIVDLEVASRAAIEWARAVKAASTAVDPAYEYRVGLIAAEPGSSKWLAKIERSPINRVAKDIQTGWQALPLIMRMSVSLAAVIPTTIVPTLEYWTGDDGFSERQKEELKAIFDTAIADPEVQEHRRAIYREAIKDPKITALGGGVPDSDEWRPKHMLPANRFAEAEGLFTQEQSNQDVERTIYRTLDVILVTPRLENAKRTWIFRQEGIPGTFSAIMADPKFLSALDKNEIHERFRLNIPMRIKLEIKEVKSGDGWKVKRCGRSVVEVISPSPDPT